MYFCYQTDETFTELLYEPEAQHLRLSKRTNLVASNVVWSCSVDFAVDCYRTVMCCA